MARPKKVDRQEFARLHRRGLTQAQLAAHFGIARSNVIAINRELGLHKRKRPPRITKTERATIERLHNAGLTAPQIAEELGRTPAAIRRVRKELGLKYARRMTPERKAHIQTMLDDGWSWAEITRTEGANWDTLTHHFPGTQWTRQQIIQHAITTRLGVEQLNAAPYAQPQRKAA